jgi:hypothetical protein
LKPRRDGTKAAGDWGIFEKLESGTYKRGGDRISARLHCPFPDTHTAFASRISLFPINMDIVRLAPPCLTRGNTKCRPRNFQLQRYDAKAYYNYINISSSLIGGQLCGVDPTSRPSRSLSNRLGKLRVARKRTRPGLIFPATFNPVRGSRGFAGNLTFSAAKSTGYGSPIPGDWGPQWQDLPPCW